MKKQIFVKDIEDQAIVNDFFSVVKKGVFTTKANSKYIALTLRDNSGAIEGKIWDRADELSPLFDKNDIVFVKSRARLYQEKIQLTITDIGKINEEIGFEAMQAFLPQSESDMEALRKEYFTITEGFRNPHLKALFSSINAKKEMVEKFFTYPASIGVHHVFLGGLMEHSLSVARMAGHAVESVGGDPEIALAGALLHDIGKIEEMNIEKGFVYNDRGRLLGHIPLGVTIFKDLIAGIDGFPAWLADALTHIIVSHHGVEEWGSPKKPMFTEALIVHYLDNLDAKIMGVKEHMKEHMEDERWSEYHRLYESRFYKLPEG